MSSIERYYREFYPDEDAGGWRPEDEATFALRVDRALRSIGASRQRVLDYGCGSGAAARLLTDAGHDVMGVDISQSGIQRARQRVPSARFELISADQELPFDPQSFDVCFCTEVIEHLFDVQGFINEINRVLVPGGLFLITTPYHGWMKNLIIITRGFDQHFDPTGGHIRFFSPTSITRCLTAGGFHVDAISGIGRRFPLWKSMFVQARRRG